MEIINFRDKLVNIDLNRVSFLYKECTPNLLVVTDTLDFNPAGDFGLTQFVNTLKAATIHGMRPNVTTASRRTDANADISNFDFTSASTGLKKSRYDVVFLFGSRSEGQLSLPAAQIEAIAKFMEAGGGVFATGDHDTLGASMCGDIPRVRAMRKWKAASAPPAQGTVTRFSTNLSGPNESEEFSDQSNTQPQRLYVNFRTQAGGIGQPHPLVQLKSPRRVLEVFPDHPHEGECIVPTSLGTSFTINGANVREWPADATGTAVVPEIVAMSVSHGDGFIGKQALSPRLFATMVAYDGQRANKGRVSTDSTWHHFININLDGTGEPGFNGLQSPPGTDTEALIRIREHFVNLATWLMPKTVRKCLRFPRLILELSRYPLFEELDIPRLGSADPTLLRDVGRQMERSLARHSAPWEVQALLADALEDAVGEGQMQMLLAPTDNVATLQASDIVHTVLGGMVAGIAERLEALKDVSEITPHQTFEPAALEGARLGAKMALAQKRAQLQHMDTWLSQTELEVV